MGWFISFLYSQLFVTPPVPTEDFTGQTIIVTGSNTGLGLEAARHLSRLNASLVILAVRNLSKGASAKESILASTGRASNSIEVWELDMHSHNSLEEFAARVNKLPRLDAILENAGSMTKYFNIVAGYETTITTNVISTFLLALLILPKLRESAVKFNIQPRLSIVASDLHFLAKFTDRNAEDIFAALNDESSALSMERYAVSKLIQVFGVRELGAINSQKSTIKTPEVIINCLTPGACKSDFDRESSRISKIGQAIMFAAIARTTEVGSRTLVAGVSTGAGKNGGYMADCQVVDPSALVLSAEGSQLQKKVWTQLMQQLENIHPGISRDV